MMKEDTQLTETGNCVGEPTGSVQDKIFDFQLTNDCADAHMCR